MNGSSLWIEDKYVNLLSSRLLRFSKKDSYTYNFRCPYCGDSQKNKFKSRGYIFQNKGHLFFKCHNCGTPKNLSTFIQDVDPSLYKEYKLEVLRETHSSTTKRPDNLPAREEKSADEPEVNLLAGLKRADHFPANHPVSEYLKRRLIPKEVIDNLYYADRFMEWINTVKPGKFTDRQLKVDEPRLVIPFIDSSGVVFAVTGRSFKTSSIKYMTIKFDEEQDKIYGMDRIDPTKRVYVVEGPIDSFFLDNSIAFAGSSGGLPKFEDMVIVLDNEPRNREIVSLMAKFISRGHSVCIWPDGTEEKDINEMVMNGMTSDEVKAVIDANTLSGLRATVRLNAFKRI